MSSFIIFPKKKPHKVSHFLSRTPTPLSPTSPPPPPPPVLPPPPPPLL